MPPIDIDKLAAAGGWVVAVAVMLGLVSLFVLERVVSGESLKRALHERDAANALLAQNSAQLDTLIKTIPELIRGRNR